MHDLVLIQDMAIVMVVSAITLVICYQLRLPVVLGYILAGFLIGPHTPPYSLVTDQHSIHTLSELGVIFLLFSIGLEFSFTKLSKVGAVAFLAATFEIIFMVAVGFVMGKALGWRDMDSLFLGAILSISSTTIIAKILMENKTIKEKFAQVILGILVVEDLWAIVMIAILSGVATTGTSINEVSIAMVKVFGFVTAVMFFGFLALPRLLRYIERFQIDEVLVVVVLGLCLGVSLIAAKAGFSIALGAFLVGAIIAETKQVHQVVIKMEPIRDMFTAIFFVSVGMLIDPVIIQQYALPIILITIAVIIGKVLSCSLVTFLTGYDPRTALAVGLGLAQIGEFSFIIAQLGRDTNVTGSFLYPVAVSVSAITTISTPFLMKNAPAIISGMKKYAPQPIITFSQVYPSWIAKMGQGHVSSRRKLMIYRDIKQHLPKLLFYAICITTIYFLANKFAYMFIEELKIYWIVVAVLIFPFFIGLAYWLDKIFWEGFVLNVVKSKSEMSHAEDAGEFFHNVTRFVVILITGLIFTSLASRIAPNIPWVVSLIILIFASAAFLVRSVIQTHEHIEKTIMGVFDHEKPLDKEQTKNTHDQLVDLIRTNYPLSFQTQDYILPFNECCLNTTIRELDLRSKTGASVVGIYRAEEVIPNPSPTIQLLPGDVLLLIGDDKQIKNAVTYLNDKIKAG